MSQPQQSPTLEQSIEQVVNDVNNIVASFQNAKTQMLGVANQLSMMSNTIDGSGKTLQGVVNFLINKVVELTEELKTTKEEKETPTQPEEE